MPKETATHVSASTETGLVKLPKMKTEVSISHDWLERRDDLISQTKGIKVETEKEFYAAADIQKAITKHSNGLEAIRKELVKPFNQASKKIKAMSDEARDSLEVAKKTVAGKIEAYAAVQRKKEREERIAAEEEARQEAERQAALQDVAADLGMEENGEQEEIVVETAVVERRAVATSVKIVQKVIVKSVDEDKIPRAFLMVDDRLVNAYIRENKDSLKEQLEKLDEGGTIEPIAGMVLELGTSSSST